MYKRQKHHLRTLTCGLSSKDTLTLSSVTAESAVICLQREIGTLGGEVLEPYEIPVKLRRAVDRMELLSLCLLYTSSHRHAGFPGDVLDGWSVFLCHISSIPFLPAVSSVMK